MKYTVQSQSSLFDALVGLFPESSKTTVRSWLKEGRVLLNERVVKLGSKPVTAGDQITFAAKQRTTRNGGIRIYYEDRHLVVIEKPARLLTVSTAFEKEETAHALLKEHYRTQEVYVVHRLDQDTAGVMLFARSEEARDKLKSMFEAHALQRVYIALVEGVLKKGVAGTWSSYLYEDGNYFVHTTEDPSRGVHAVTHYEVLQAYPSCSLLQLVLETGRKNQIRVHCQAAGHSVVGDKKYGASGRLTSRLCLHAHSLAFAHPITEQKMHFVSPLPDLFKRISVKKLTFYTTHHAAPTSKTRRRSPTS